MSNPTQKVSVIIPFLNAGSWLKEAIESVLNQTYKNWELILVDDGSSFEDVAIAKSYVEQFSNRIYYICHANHINKGLPASRNLGTKQAKGEFIAFLDADDIWTPSKLTNQLNIFSLNTTVEMVCEASIFWYSWLHANTEDFKQLIGAPCGVYKPTALLDFLYPFADGQPPCPSGILITKEAIERNGGFEESFSGENQLYEDQAFLFKIYYQESVYISAQANNYYRKRQNSMSSSASDPVIYQRVRSYFASWVASYLEKEGRSSDYINRLLRNFKNKSEPLNH